MENKKTEKKPVKMLLSTLRILVMSVALTAVLIMFSYTYVYGKQQDKIESLASSGTFSLIDTKTLDGEQFNADNIKDCRLTVLNVWGTNCPPCIRELPDLDKVNKYYDNDQVQVVGLCADVVSKDGVLQEDKLQAAKKIVDENNITFTQIYSDDNLVSFIAANVAATPTTFFIDHEGNVIKSNSGSAEYDKWIESIDEVLSELHD